VISLPGSIATRTEIRDGNGDGATFEIVNEKDHLTQIELD
jgi:hypothetical protein